MQLQPISLSGDIALLPLVEEHHFRTDRLTALFCIPLTEETASECAILPGLLTRSCRSFPSLTALNRRLDDLYGAFVSSDVLTVGGWQVLRFSLGFLNHHYTMQKEDLTKDCTQLLLDMLFDPALEDGCFRTEDFLQEKRCLIEHLESEINNKRLYARQRCRQLLCPHQPAGICPEGSVETAKALSVASVTEAWKTLLKTARVRFIYQGSDEPNALLSQIEERFSALPEREPAFAETDPSFAIKETQETETMAVKQAKMVLGFRIAATEPGESVMAARVMNTLFGADASSLLFTHVREEQSLCYYCASSYDRIWGILLVDCGIQEKDAVKTKEEILRQLDALRQGQFTEEEWEACRKSVIRRFLSVNETPASRESFYLSQAVFDRYLSPEETVQKIKAVTREDVCKVAQSVHLDTTYLLKPNGDEDSEKGEA